MSEEKSFTVIDGFPEFAKLLLPLSVKVSSSLTFKYSDEEDQTPLLVYISKHNQRPSEGSHEIKLVNPETIPICFIKEIKFLFIGFYTERMCEFKIKYEIGIV